MQRITIILLLLIGIVTIPFIIQAQDTEEQTSIVTLTILPASRLSITDQDVSKTVEIGSEAIDSFGKGFVEFPSNKPTLTLDANNNWKLTVSSTDFSGPYAKPAKDLMLKDLASQNVTNGFSAYKSLSSNDQEIASSSIGVRNETHPCQYKILLDWEQDIPGTYSAIVTYTLTTNAS